jgi:hypothetical protein
MARSSTTTQELSPVPLSAGAGPRGRSARGAFGRVAHDRTPMEPRSAAQVLDLGLDVVRERFAALVGLCALVWLPVRALQPFIGQHVFAGSRSQSAEMLSVFGTLFNAMGSALTQVFASVLLAQLVFASLRGERASFSAAVRATLRRSFGVILIAIVTAILSGVGVMLLCVGWLFFSWKLALAPSVYVLEGASVGQSLQRSFSLCIGSFWRWLLLALVLWLLSWPLKSVATFGDLAEVRAVVLARLHTAPALFDWLLVLLSSLFEAVASALSAAVFTVFYLDCRVRREGVDLERALISIEREAGASQVAA